MSKFFLTITLVIICAGGALAQRERTTTSADASSATSINRDGRSLDIESGTRLAAQLQSTLDARHARVGDEVVLKTTQAIKSNGRTVVNKGARLVGRVTDVQQKAGKNGESRIGLVFDQLESGSLSTPITATITSITQARSQSSLGNDDILSDTSARSSSSSSASRSSSGGGGLLGGVTGTVGGVLDSTTQATGNVVGNTTGAVGGTVNGVTRNLGGIRISQSADARAEGSSTLSLTGDNLHLEKGTTFNLAISQTTDAGTNQ